MIKINLVVGRDAVFREVMRFKDPIEFSSAVALMKQKTAVIAPYIKRPSKPLKGLSARNPAEQHAMCRAVVLSVQKAKNDGTIVREPDGGWRIRWTKND